MKKVTAQDGLQIALSMFMVASLACVAVGVRADEVNEAAVRTVRYSDLNLNTQAGAAVLYNRIHNAAVAVCGDADARRLAEAVAVKACIDRAMSQSVSSVNSTKLTSEFKARTGVATQQTISVASR